MSKPGNYTHIIRLGLLLVVAFGTLGYVRSQLIPETFGQYGTYRGASVEDIRASKKKFVGSQKCRRCHKAAYKLWESQDHKTVSCESCHGAGHEHLAKILSDEDPMTTIAKGAEYLKANSRELCASCHEMIPGRPDSFPQVDMKEHIDRLEVDEDHHMYPKLYQCVECHLGHKPYMF